MNRILDLIDRKEFLFDEDIEAQNELLINEIMKSRFLVIGAAGTIGQAVTKEIFKRDPKKLHAVDISENNLVELVRDLRSSHGYTSGEFKTLALDIGSEEYDAFIAADGEYDYVLNLSALKHVRSERDPFTLIRMIKTNIFNTEKTLKQAINKGVKKYFCVSTDKAANPVNMMGASKRIMELFLLKYSKDISISTARFANVAFSDGSLLHGFRQRLIKGQPIVAPNDVKRYFVTPEESGELCLLSCLTGGNRDVFFPKLNDKLHLTKFSDIAVKFLQQEGKTAITCSSEEEARELAVRMRSQLNDQWPCYFHESDTTGEKGFEEFYTNSESVDFDTFINIGVVKNNLEFDDSKLNVFKQEIEEFIKSKCWRKPDLVEIFKRVLPEFEHEEKGKYLDSRM